MEKIAPKLSCARSDRGEVNLRPAHRETLFLPVRAPYDYYMVGVTRLHRVLGPNARCRCNNHVVRAYCIWGYLVVKTARTSVTVEETAGRFKAVKMTASV